MLVYFKSIAGKYGIIDVPTDNHRDAILHVKESLVASGEGFAGAVLVLIHSKEK